MTSKIVVNNIESDSGISSITFNSNVQRGSSNFHSVGVEVAGVNVLGADTPIGTGSTIYDDGGARFSGIVTATTFSGSGANLTSLPAANLTGTLPAISGTNLTGLTAGITMADAWVQSTSYTKSGGMADVTANWVRHSNGASYIGHIGSSLMAESSGVFTFPTTGIYMVTSTLAGRTDGGYASYAGMRQYYSGNSGSSYNVVASGYDHGDRASAHFVSNQTVLYDITDVSIARIKFDIENSHAIKVFGNSVNRNTGATFIRLGDT